MIVAQLCRKPAAIQAISQHTARAAYHMLHMHMTAMAAWYAWRYMPANSTTASQPAVLYPGPAVLP
jgi:hypothetical protein